MLATIARSVKVVTNYKFRMRPKICPVVVKQKNKGQIHRSGISSGKQLKTLAFGFSPFTNQRPNMEGVLSIAFPKSQMRINKSVSGALLLCQMVGVANKVSIRCECSIPNFIVAESMSRLQFDLALFSGSNREFIVGQVVFGAIRFGTVELVNWVDFFG